MYFVLKTHIFLYFRQNNFDQA